MNGRTAVPRNHEGDLVVVASGAVRVGAVVLVEPIKDRAEDTGYAAATETTNRQRKGDARLLSF